MKNEWRNIGLAEVHPISTKNTESSRKPAYQSMDGNLVLQYIPGGHF
jgi:hypothetical protein